MSAGSRIFMSGKARNGPEFPSLVKLSRHKEHFSVSACQAKQWRLALDLSQVQTSVCLSVCSCSVTLDRLDIGRSLCSFTSD